MADGQAVGAVLMFSTARRKVVSGIAVSVAAIGLIAGYEGFVDHTYVDAVGVKTIGFGHTGPDVKAGQTVTRKAAEELLVRDADAHWEQARKYIRVPLFQHEADAYASFIFNVGVGSFRSSTLLKRLNSGDYSGACAQLKRWVYAGGKRLNGLVKRREAEYRLCMGGVR